MFYVTLSSYSIIFRPYIKDEQQNQIKLSYKTYSITIIDRTDNKTKIKIMQLKKTLSSFSNFSSKNIEDQQLIERAIKQQLLDDHKVSKGQSQILPIVQLSRSKQSKLLKIEIVQEEQEKKMKYRVNNRHLLNFFPVYTTLMDSQFLKTNYNTTSNRVDKNGCKRDEQQTYENKYERQRIVYERKSLAPVKKPKQQKRLENKNVHISFLSVQKAPCFYQELKNYDKNSMTITTAALTKNKFFITRKSFESSQTIDYMNNPQNELYLKEEKARISRNRPFVAPFERYNYFDFLWKVSITNGIRIEFPETYTKKFKAYVGRGNNSNLIKTLLKRREAWWTITDKIEQANFIWTQLKINTIFNGQDSCQPAPLIEQSDSLVVNQTPIYKRNRKIMSENLTALWINYFNQNKETELKMTPSLIRRNKIIRKGKVIGQQADKLKVHNHVQRNYVLGNKKALFATMRKYYETLEKNVFEYLPLTFHIQSGLEDPQYYSFLKYFHNKAKQNKLIHRHHNIWIVKPGQLTNRGNGITVCHNLEEIKAILKTKVRLDNGGDRTYIVQEYLERPFLYFGRKFDIRHYMLFTFVNGHIKGYWCELGYIRTTSYEYSLNNGYGSVHLTNDAVQKQLPDYGKFQKGNKLSYQQFQNYLQTECCGKYSFFKTVYPQMKRIAYDSMRASALLLDEDRKGHNFQIFGFDFMIDAKFHPWLIEINTNPCLELNSPVLMDVIPKMVQNALKIGLDTIFPPPQQFTQKRARFNNNVLQQNIFELLFDSTLEQKQLRQMNSKEGQNNSCLNFKELQKDQDEIYEDDGVMLQD